MKLPVIQCMTALLLLAAVVSAGDTKTVVMSVSGMHCSSCAEGITAMLKRTDGVLKTEVSYEERQATVDYDEAKTSPEKIITAIEKMGYKARIKK